MICVGRRGLTTYCYPTISYSKLFREACCRMSLKCTAVILHLGRTMGTISVQSPSPEVSGVILGLCVQRTETLPCSVSVLVLHLLSSLAAFWGKVRLQAESD